MQRVGLYTKNILCTHDNAIIMSLNLSSLVVVIFWDLLLLTIGELARAKADNFKTLKANIS